MIYVLDINAVSALIKGDPRTTRHLREASPESVLVPQPVLAEIAYGIERLPQSKRKDTLRRNFELAKQELPRVAWTDAVSEAYGAIKSRLERDGTHIEDFDAAIAAHALARGATLVTANVAHMTRVPGLRVEDWEREPERPA